MVYVSNDRMMAYIRHFSIAQGLIVDAGAVREHARDHALLLSALYLGLTDTFRFRPGVIFRPDIIVTQLL